MPDTDVPAELSAAGDPVEFALPLKALPDRLDKVLAGLMPEHSRSRLQGWIESGHVLVNGRAARVRQAVGAGDKISVWMQPTPESLAFCAEPVDFRVLAESADWIVVDKPAGLVTHPGAGNWHGTLLNGLLYRYPELRQVARAGIVHRLDKDTSGLLVVARHERSQTDLVRQLQARTVRREYLALVHGTIQPEVEALVRVHEPTSVLDVLDTGDTGHSWSVSNALAAISAAASGVLVLLNCQGSAELVFSQFAAWERTGEVRKSADTRFDLRTYGIGAQILRDLNVGRARLLARPRKMPSMAGFSLSITGYDSEPLKREPLNCEPLNPAQQEYPQ